jgi:hypothetical protein
VWTWRERGGQGGLTVDVEGGVGQGLPKCGRGVGREASCCRRGRRVERWRAGGPNRGRGVQGGEGNVAVDEKGEGRDCGLAVEVEG